MSQNWRNATVAELQVAGVLLVEDGNHGEYRPRPHEFESEGVAFIRAADLSDGRVRFETAERINPTAMARIRKGIGKPGDILLSHKGTVGKLAMVSLDAEPFVCSPQTTFWRVLDEDVLERRYLFAYLRSPAFVEQLSSRKGETDMADYVSLTNQRGLRVTIPPIAEQRAIAHVLGTLDDKIELNRRMNQTLEEIARTIFTSWFINFGPVRARAEGRQPEGMDATTAALFPDRFESCEMGEVPEGWRVATFGEIAVNPRRVVNPSTVDPHTPYIGLEHMPRRSIALSDWDGAGKVGSGKFEFREGEILFGKLRPYFHKVGVAPVDGICSTDILVIAPIDRHLRSLVLAHASSDRFVVYANAGSDGTRMPRTNWDRLSTYRICLPPEPAVKAFDDLVRPFVARIRANIFESRTLADLRDTLLPKLLSGELRVPEAEPALAMVPWPAVARPPPRTPEGLPSMPTAFTESVVEETALAWFVEVGWDVLFGPDIAHDGPNPERTSYREVALTGRLHDALARLNPDASPEARDEAFRQVAQIGSPSLVAANRAFHKLLSDGVAVTVLRSGEQRGELVHLIDFDDPANNDWLAVNQFTVVEGQIERRPDIVLFANGLPLAVVELKNTADEGATVDHAFNQLQTYMAQIPRLFHSNELLVISDGARTEIGCVTTPRERFAAWKTVDGDELFPTATLEVAIKGAFEPRRFLDLVRSFVVFEDDGKTVSKKVAQYHQFHAVRKALSTALRASSTGGNLKGGVLWHTQGSGKSLTMLFFAGKLIAHPSMANPTIVMLTDRTDLDDQLFGTFAAGKDLLRQDPVQAESRSHLRELLQVNAGGVVFTTIQKFFPAPGQEDYPLLSDRRNIVVMADEAHRSQYGFGTRVGETGKFVRGFAQHMRDALPGATFVAFTGTPLELEDKDTRLVFGDYIDIYDVGRAIADGATVPIYYESRLIKLDLPEDQANLLDEEFEELTEDQEKPRKDRLKTKWAQLEAVVGTPKRLAQVAADLAEHMERRQEALAGKVMVVCMSRRICVDLYDQLVALRPDWHGEDDATGAVKVVMTGSASDDLHWQLHIRNKERRERLADRFKDPDDPFRIVIVRDMWLTGFDVPPLHTMYLDKPMRGHGLMQAITRVNRVFRDKPGGLVVDYLGLANNLKAALRAYIREDGAGTKPIENEKLDVGELVAAMIEKLELCREAFRGFSYGSFLSGSETERLDTIKKAQEFLILRDYMEKGADVIARFLDHAAALLKAFALASATKEAQKVKTEVAFFQTVKAALTKTTGRSPGKSDENLDHAVRQLVDAAIAPEGVVDIFAAAGLEKPDISILSDAFLAEIRGMPQRNLALELLRKLLNDEIGAASRTSVVQSRRFSEKLEEALNRYHNRALEMAQIIEALIDLARELREANTRGERLGLSEDEVAFYDALGTNDSAVQVLGDDQLRVIAREVADTVRDNVSIDWSVRENTRANLRRLVRRVLRRHGYPPDQQEVATLLVIEQAELLARDATEPLPV